MKNLLIIFLALFITGVLITTVKAKDSDKIDEIDFLLSKVSKNVEASAEVTKIAQSMNAAMVTSKVAEKEALKKEIAASEEKIGKYIKTMLIFDVDTSYVNLEIDTAQLNNMKRLNQIK
jgi:hypothetical protein